MPDASSFNGGYNSAAPVTNEEFERYFQYEEDPLGGAQIVGKEGYVATEPNSPVDPTDEGTAPCCGFIQPPVAQPSSTSTPVDPNDLSNILAQFVEAGPPPRPPRSPLRPRSPSPLFTPRGTSPEPDDQPSQSADVNNDAMSSNIASQASSTISSSQLNAPSPLPPALPPAPQAFGSFSVPSAPRPFGSQTQGFQSFSGLPTASGSASVSHPSSQGLRPSLIGWSQGPSAQPEATGQQLESASASQNGPRTTNSSIPQTYGVVSSLASFGFVSAHPTLRGQLDQEGLANLSQIAPSGLQASDETFPKFGFASQPSSVFMPQASAMPLSFAHSFSDDPMEWDPAPQPEHQLPLGMPGLCQPQNVFPSAPLHFVSFHLKTTFTLPMELRLQKKQGRNSRSALRLSSFSRKKKWHDPRLLPRMRIPYCKPFRGRYQLPIPRSAKVLSRPDQHYHGFGHVVRLQRRISHLSPVRCSLYKRLRSLRPKVISTPRFLNGLGSYRRHAFNWARERFLWERTAQRRVARTYYILDILGLIPIRERNGAFESTIDVDVEMDVEMTDDLAAPPAVENTHTPSDAQPAESQQATTYSSLPGAPSADSPHKSPQSQPPVEEGSPRQATRGAVEMDGKEDQDTPGNKSREKPAITEDASRSFPTRPPPDALPRTVNRASSPPAPRCPPPRARPSPRTPQPTSVPFSTWLNGSSTRPGSYPRLLRPSHQALPSLIPSSRKHPSGGIPKTRAFRRWREEGDQATIAKFRIQQMSTRAEVEPQERARSSLRGTRRAPPRHLNRRQEPPCEPKFSSQTDSGTEDLGSTESVASAPSAGSCVMSPSVPATSHPKPASWFGDIAPSLVFFAPLVLLASLSNLLG